MVVGFWLRVRHLGDLALIVDEGVQALAVKGILKHGVPKVDSGHIFTRALSFLYIQAAAVRLFELNPFWLRLPSVIFGGMVIIPSYIMGKTLFDRRIGLLTAAILAFSVWEIELSRYARFYTAFQFMYLLSLVCFYKGFMLDERNYKIGFLLTAFITFSTHSLSHLLIVLFFIPLISCKYELSRKLVFCLWAIGLFGLQKVYLKLIRLFKALGEPSLDVNGAVAETGSSIFETIRLIAEIPPFYLPDLRFFLQTVQNNLLPLAGLAMIASIATIYLIYRSFQKDSILRVLLAISIICLAIIYQFGFVLIMLGLYLVLFVRDLDNLKEPLLKIVYGNILICLVIWSVIILRSTGISLKQGIAMLFGFPNFYQYFLYWLIRGWPIMTAVLILGCIMLLSRYFSNRRDPVPLFVLGSIFIPALIASFFKSYHESRYTFHLYPLIVIVFSMVSIRVGSYILQNSIIKEKWSRNLVTFSMLVAILFISQDANPLHAWSIGNRTYQSVKDPIRSVISWKFYAGFHQDHRNPSVYVKDHLSREDQVVALGPIHMIELYHFYVGKVDYAVVPSENPYYYGKMKGGKIINYITGSELINGVSKVKNLIEQSSNVIWILGDRKLLNEENNFYSEPMKEYIRSLVYNPDYVGLDGLTFVGKVR
jgi:hypothetical protein